LRYSADFAARPTLVVANKCEAPATLLHVQEARSDPSLGDVEIVAVSALHGRNLDQLALAMRRLVSEGSSNNAGEGAGSEVNVV
jgi:predicted GTPase